ncbi:MAG: hypothetical protein EHM48_09335 [Planctomycetaceae bacterium]|nr:MAG: hypothetical protein EHM48_09335 [Planctomycetaceae bacterium]
MVTVNDNVAEFSFYRPKAKHVHILGDFNGWREGELPMTRTADGNWVAKIHLPAGDFKFRYRVDGQWFIDYAAFGVECGDFGMDSIVRIAPQQNKAKVTVLPAKTAKVKRVRPAAAISSTMSSVA